MPDVRECWKFGPKADDFTFLLFVRSIADIAESARYFSDLSFRGRLGTHSFQKSARDMSVAIRKVLLDKGGHLFTTCVASGLHPLKRPGKGQGTDVLVEETGNLPITYTVGGSDLKRTATFPSYEHRTVVKPLYGLRRTGKEQYQLEFAFDLSRQPLKRKHWLKIKVLQVGDIVLTAERMLRLMTNKEGAHDELNEMIRRSTSSSVNLKLPDDDDELYRRGNWVTFGGVSYMHIFTLLVGMYLVSMMKVTLEHAPEKTKKNSEIAYLSSVILETPLGFGNPTLPLAKEYNIGRVFYAPEDPNKPLRPIGGNVGTTTIQIPA